ncbi:TPA: hypothetical protein MEW76_001168 [Klebsiella aerogenes]|nr:hypothetical protein [Klebsiella aerogenes]
MKIKAEFSRISWGYVIREGGLHRHGIMIVNIEVDNLVGTEPDFVLNLEYQRQYDEKISMKVLVDEAEQWARSQLTRFREFKE